MRLATQMNLKTTKYIAWCRTCNAEIEEVTTWRYAEKPITAWRFDCHGEWAREEVWDVELVEQNDNLVLVLGRKLQDTFIQFEFRKHKTKGTLAPPDRSWMKR